MIVGEAGDGLTMEALLLVLGFKPDEKGFLRYNGKDKHWEYRVYFEGYAYVIYKVWRTNKTKEHEIPLAEFQNPYKFRKFWQLLTEYIEE